jgi:hypothetical protein
MLTDRGEQLEQARLASRFGRREGAMGRLNRYRRSSTECLALADFVSHPDDRALLVAMAARWHDLAERLDMKEGREDEPHLERRARFHVVSERPDLCARRDKA